MVRAPWPQIIGSRGVYAFSRGVSPVVITVNEGVFVSAVLSISDSIERGFDTFFESLPSLVGALIVLIIG